MEYLTRRAGLSDAPIIASQRAAMFRDMGDVTPEESISLRQASEPWLAGLLDNGNYIGWLVEHGSTVVAGGGIIVRDSMPVPGCYRVGRWAHVVNVYTDPDHRRRGLARRLMNTILDWCAANGMDRVTLAASREGRPLYESLGFQPTNEMRLLR